LAEAARAVPARDKPTSLFQVPIEKRPQPRGVSRGPSLFMLECPEQRATWADRSEDLAESCAGLHSFRAASIGLGGARAMAVAMLYPKPEKGGRGKTSNSLAAKEFSSAGQVCPRAPLSGRALRFKKTADRNPSDTSWRLNLEPP
jgi:hypothetical protein